MTIGHRRGCQKCEPGILLHEKRNDENDPREKCAQWRKTLALQLQEQKDAAQNDESAVRVVERMRKDAVDPQHRERRGQQKRHETERRQDAAQKMDQNPPRQNCPQAANDRAVQHVVKEDPAGELDQERLNQKSSGSVRKRKIAIRKIAEGNPVGVFQNIAEVPENREPRILPYDDCGSAEKKERAAAQSHRTQRSRSRNWRASRSGS